MANRTRIFIISFTVFLFIMLQIFVYTTYQRQVNSAITSVKEGLITHAITLTTVTEERFALLHGIEAFIRTVGFDADERIMLPFLEKIHEQSPGIKGIIIAPNGLVKYIYPLAGNELMLHSDYMSNTGLATPEVLAKTLSSRIITLDGPRELKQSGLGIIARQAIYEDDQFMGLIAITISFDELINKSSIDHAFMQNDSFVISKSDGTLLYGNAETLTVKPVSVPVPLLNDQWTLSATPTKKEMDQILLRTLLMEVAGIVIIALQFHTFRRQFLFNVKLEQVVAQRTKALHSANEDLLAVEEELRYQNDLLENRTIELEVSERKYEQLAYHDALTSISNRLYFIEQLQVMLQNQHSIGDDKIALFFFDINQFNEINDTFGHSIGDQVLIAITERIKASSLKYHIFARIGGDEFVLVFDRISDPSEAQAIADTVIKLFSDPFHIDGLNIHTSVSIGIALYPEHGSTSEELMKHADLAMFMTKKTSGINYRFFDLSMMDQLIQKRDFPILFNKAMEKGEIVLYYQPQIDIATQQIIGLEALARWIHPVNGLTKPADFIPLAEEMGLITALTDYVIAEACKQSLSWREKGLPPIKISVNLSSAWFFKQNVEQEFFSTLKRYHMSPSDIELEITENIALMDECYPVLEKMLQAGVTVAIDDFGLAYSSLSYLKRFPINKIKIDQSFIRGIGINHIDETIVQAISFITKRLDYQVIAEGVEANEQADFLHEHGCTSAQGYLYFRPMPADQAERLLRENSKICSNWRN